MTAHSQNTRHRRGYRRLRGLVAAVAVLAMGAGGALTASAATTTSWADWAPLEGSAGAYRTTMTLPGQPEIVAQVTSDSRGGQVGVISGASTWLSEGTAIGAKYGSSRDLPYLNLRPRADSATAPSVTTYSFDRPTPSAGWAFAFGDIDADAIRLRGVSADGTALTAADLGFQGGFNYCAPGVTGKPSCTGDAADVPTWDADELTLTGNAAAVDTSGAAAWFEPTVAISSLTVEFTRRSGFPVYQTWFSSIARDITGTVSHNEDGPLAGVALSLIDANGDVVATATSAEGGAYVFGGFTATDGYRVVLTPPDGTIAVTGSGTADLTETDAVVDLTVRDIVPVAVSGTVTRTDGSPVVGLTVTVEGPDGPLTAVTGADGGYLFDTVPVGDADVVIVPPSGFTSEVTTRPITVPEGSEAPITGIDFVLAENPTLTGVVTAGGAGLAGVTVTATGPDGTLTTVTGADGGYSFPRIPGGEYEVTVTQPAGTTPVTPITRNESVGATDVENVDFEFAYVREGALTGVVTDGDGTPIAGVDIVIAGPDGDVTVTTDDSGAYGVGDLTAGTYSITVAVPDGYTLVGDASLTVTITDAGETVVDQDFVLAIDDDTVPTEPPGDGDGDGGGDGGGGAVGGDDDSGVGEDESLATTGADVPTPLVLGGLAALLAGVTLLTVAGRRRVTG